MLPWFGFCCRNGFEDERIEALLHKIEIQMKHQSTNFGLSLASVSSPPISKLRFISRTQGLCVLLRTLVWAASCQCFLWLKSCIYFLLSVYFSTSPVGKHLVTLCEVLSDFIFFNKLFFCNHNILFELNAFHLFQGLSSLF